MLNKTFFGSDLYIYIYTNCYMLPYTRKKYNKYNTTKVKIGIKYFKDKFIILYYLYLGTTKVYFS